jgi:hypothetical protein
MMSRIQTAEQVSREPADFIPFLALQHLLCREWRTVQSGSRTGSSRLVRRQDHGQGCGRSWELPISPQMICFFYTGWKVFWETTCTLSWPEFFLCGHPRGCHGFTPPVHALSQQKKKVILRNINRQNTLIQTNPGFL